MASLLPEHPGPDLCGGQQRQREDTGGTGRATEDGNRHMVAKSSDPDPNKKLGVWIRILMDIFGILDPDPHETLCGSETQILMKHFSDLFFSLPFLVPVTKLCTKRCKKHLLIFYNLHNSVVFIIPVIM